jgi:hypothetical protein
MNGLAIAAAPLGAAGLGTLTAGFPGARPETIRIDAVLSILGEGGHLHAGVPVHMTIGQEQ